MTCVCRPRRYDVQKIKMAAVLQLKIINYILETKISFLPRHGSSLECVRVTSSDMTSFVYIGDESIICRNGSERKRNDPSKKKLCHRYSVIEESKDELQKMLDKPGNSQ